MRGEGEVQAPGTERAWWWDEEWDEEEGGGAEGVTVRRGGGRQEHELALPRLCSSWADVVDPDYEEQVVPWPQYADDPVGFIRDVLRVEFLTDEQVAICRRVRDRPDTTVQAGNSVGKSFLAACLVLWWVFAVGGLCVTTAPTQRLVTDVLWHEVRQLYDANAHRLGGTRLETRVHLTEAARAYGYTASEQREGASFGGRHGARVLAIQDEASAIARTIDDVFDSLTTGTGNRQLRIGNPLDESSAFGDHCKREGTIQVPVWTHPNVSWAYERDADGVHRLREEVDRLLPRDDEGQVQDEEHWPEELPRSRVEGAVSVQWVEKERQKPSHGPGSVWWQQHLDAEYADDPVDSLVPRGWYERARARYDADPERWDAMAAGHAWEHGLDVGDGRDPHAKVSRRGPVVYDARKVVTQGDTRDVDRAVQLAMQRLDARWGVVKVDRAGPGSGVAQQLRKQRLPHRKPPAYEEWAEGEANVRVDAVSFGAGAQEPGRFTNLKAEAFWKLREAFERGEVAIAPLPDDVSRELKEELAAIRYEYTATDKVRMEKKAKTRKRLGRSTDLADALAFAFWRTGREMEITVGGYGRGDELPGYGTL